MTITLMGLAAALGGCATDDRGASTAGETYIPFVSSQGIIEWKRAGEDALYVRAITGDWYLVRTMGRCSGLATTLGIGFEATGIGQFDRGGAIIAEGRRCPVTSVRRSDPPPGERGRRG